MVQAKDVPGDARASAMAVQRALLRVGEQLVRAEGLWERLDGGGLEVISMGVRLPQYVGGDYLVTVRAYKDGEAVVGFHGADTFADVARGVLARMENGSMKWRKDEYERGTRE